MEDLLNVPGSQENSTQRPKGKHKATEAAPEPTQQAPKAPRLTKSQQLIAQGAKRRNAGSHNKEQYCFGLSVLRFDSNTGKQTIAITREVWVFAEEVEKYLTHLPKNLYKVSVLHNPTKNNVGEASIKSGRYQKCLAANAAIESFMQNVR